MSEWLGLIFIGTGRNLPVITCFIIIKLSLCFLAVVILSIYYYTIVDWVKDCIRSIRRNFASINEFLRKQGIDEITKEMMNKRHSLYTSQHIIICYNTKSEVLTVQTSKVLEKGALPLNYLINTNNLFELYKVKMITRNIPGNS